MDDDGTVPSPPLLREAAAHVLRRFPFLRPAPVDDKMAAWLFRGVSPTNLDVRIYLLLPEVSSGDLAPHAHLNAYLASPSAAARYDGRALKVDWALASAGLRLMTCTGPDSAPLCAHLDRVLATLCTDDDARLRANTITSIEDEEHWRGAGRLAIEHDALAPMDEGVDDDDDDTTMQMDTRDYV